jgi:DNA-binding transcriptional LysR family regulator
VISDRWHGLEVRHLVALKAIAEEGTFAAAAARLGYTQSAVSQQIAALEKLTGATLIVRSSGRRPLGLTDAGILVLRHGEAIMARVQAAQADLATLDAGAAGPVRVGTYPSVGVRVLPELLPAFARKIPAVTVALHESNSDAELLKMLERGELDLAFCMLPLGEGPFDALELLRDPWLLVAGAAGDGRRDRPRPLDHEQRILTFRTCPTIGEIESLLRRHGVEPAIAFRSDDQATLQSLVGAGMGIAFMPSLTVDPHDPRTVLVDVRAELVPRRVALAWHRDRQIRRAAAAFIEAASAIARTIQRDIDSLPLAPVEDCITR